MKRSWLALLWTCGIVVLWSGGACIGASGERTAAPKDDGEEYYFPCLCKDQPQYTKLDSAGQPLPDSATKWVMVLDRRSGLVWEVKTDDGSIRDRDRVFFWCNSDPVASRSVTGRCDREDSTEQYIQTLNKQKLGGRSSWRMPTVSELAAIRIRHIVKEGKEIDYFPNTAQGKYWTATTCKRDGRDAWFVNFVFGTAMIDRKSTAHHVRAVSGPK